MTTQRTEPVAAVPPLAPPSTGKVGVYRWTICALLFTVFVIGYLAALIRYLCAKPEEQQAMERLITVSANAIVSILTLTAATLPGQAKYPTETTSR